MLDQRHRYSFAFTAIVASTTVVMALAASTTAADIVIDEFSHVGMFENPWPYSQNSSGGAPQFFEAVEAGVIQGKNGRIRETDIHMLGFDLPDDHAEMGVETASGTFEHTATDGVATLLWFSYGFVIQNNLHADLSETIGLRIDIANLQPGPDGHLQMSALISDGSVYSESGLVFETEAGPHSVLLPFADFDFAGDINLAEIGAIEISFYATHGTDFSIERLVAAQQLQGDANADLVVDLQDFMAVITAWGDCIGCDEDFNDDDIVGINDLLIVLANWGP